MTKAEHVRLFKRILQVRVENVKDAGTDWCSCSPDVVYGVRISRACRLHDAAYAVLEAARPTIGYWRFVYLRFIADHKLRHDIVRLGELAGRDLSAIAQLYCGAVHVLNPLFRLLVRITGRNFN